MTNIIEQQLAWRGRFLTANPDVGAVVAQIEQTTGMLSPDMTGDSFANGARSMGLNFYADLYGTRKAAFESYHNDPCPIRDDVPETNAAAQAASTAKYAALAGVSAASEATPTAANPIPARAPEKDTTMSNPTSPATGSAAPAEATMTPERRRELLAMSGIVAKEDVNKVPSGIDPERFKELMALSRMSA